MAAIEELRRLLDERGVKWTDHGYKNHVWWKGFDGVRWHAENRYCVDGWRVKVEAIITPEQAIAATLGRGECKIVSYTTDGLVSNDPKRFFHLSCGHWVGLPGLTDTPKFCPECGSKVNEFGLKVRR